MTNVVAAAAAVCYFEPKTLNNWTSQGKSETHSRCTLKWDGKCFSLETDVRALVLQFQFLFLKNEKFSVLPRSIQLCDIETTHFCVQSFIQISLQITQYFFRVTHTRILQLIIVFDCNQLILQFFLSNFLFATANTCKWWNYCSVIRIESSGISLLNMTREPIASACLLVHVMRKPPRIVRCFRI